RCDIRGALDVAGSGIRKDGGLPAVSRIPGELGVVDRVLGDISDVVLLKRRQNATGIESSDCFVSFERGGISGAAAPSIVSSGVAILVLGGGGRGLSGCVGLFAAERAAAWIHPGEHAGRGADDRGGTVPLFGSEA